ncbi:hypothetical protein Tco_0750578 [Tanacetum coccineum]|uniref:Reverse transcriptase Ty1/copia-type domain-containing protein n=1 Tax=Tanacetum coccineum TaxID=301880 RepID=A0ABQ4Z4E2_9ASTR
MCMFTLTVSTDEPKNIKEAMANSAWIEAMQEELHQFDRLQVWELVDKPFGKNIIKLTWLWKNKKMKTKLYFTIGTTCSYKGYWVRKRMDVKTTFLNGPLKEEVYVAQPDGTLDPPISKSTPMATKPKLDADLSGKLVDQTDYRSKIGSLMYLTSSRPDIVQVICYCARTLVSEGFLGLELTSVFRMADMPGSEAEYVALSASCAQVMWMKTQLKDYGFNYNKIPLYCDSQSAITISCNPVQYSRTKHIHTQYHFIKEQVENGIIELYFVRTEYQLADMFTKALPKDRRSDIENKLEWLVLTEPEDSYKDGDGDTSFQ